MKTSYLTVPVSCFLGAFGAYLAANSPPVWSLATLKPALMGGTLAGIISVAHLYQPAPEVKP